MDGYGYGYGCGYSPWAYERLWHAGGRSMVPPVRWGVQIVTDATTEPITQQELLDFARIVAGDEEPTVMAQCITAARHHVEHETGLALATITLDCFADTLPTWGAMELPWPPLQTVLAVDWTDADGIGHVVDPSAYLVNAARLPARLVFQPGTQPGTGAARPFLGWHVQQTVGYLATPPAARRQRGTVTPWGAGAPMIYATATNPNSIKAGEIRINQTDPTLATALYVHDQGSDGSDVHTAAMQVAPGDRILIADAADASNALTFAVTGPPADQNKYVTVPASFVEGTGASFTDQQAVTVSEPTLITDPPVDERTGARVLPGGLKLAVLILAAHYLTTARDLAALGTTIAETPYGYADAVAPYRLTVLA